jgi:alkylhydroperoxidase/carboxymuconolactone decarboxylase family protein YurZ
MVQGSVKEIGPQAYVRAIAPEVATCFRSLRDAAVAAGPLDPGTCELIILATFAMVAYEQPFKNHAARAKAHGVTLDAARHAIIITLAATCSIKQVADALEWLDQAYAS